MKTAQEYSGCWIAKGAAVVGEVTLGEGCGVWFNAVLRGDEGAIVVGQQTNIQDGAVLHEAVCVGRGCTIGHGAIVHGCTVGDNTLIGMGAILLTGAQVGEDCVVGAGALVTSGAVIPSGMLALGSPAKVVRPLTAEEIEMNRRSAAHYVALAEQYRQRAQRP